MSKHKLSTETEGTNVTRLPDPSSSWSFTPGTTAHTQSSHSTPLLFCSSVLRNTSVQAELLKSHPDFSSTWKMKEVANYLKKAANLPAFSAKSTLHYQAPKWAQQCTEHRPNSAASTRSSHVALPLTSYFRVLFKITGNYESIHQWNKIKWRVYRMKKKSISCHMHFRLVSLNHII